MIIMLAPLLFATTSVWANLPEKVRANAAALADAGANGSGGGGNPDRVREPRVPGGGAAGGGGAREPGPSGGGHVGGGHATDTRTSGGGGPSPSGSGGGSSGSSGSGGSGSSGGGSNSGGGGGNSGPGSANSGSGSSGGGSGGNSGSSETALEHSTESVESVAEMRALAARETPEFDPQGFPVRRGEVIGLDLSRREVARVRALGFAVASEKALGSLDMHVTRLRAPPDMPVTEAVRLLRSGLPDTDTVYDFDHFYGVNGYEDDRARTRAVPPPRGNLWIGMIDTGVARHTALQGVHIDSHDFATGGKRAAQPSKHGTAVASILARSGAGHITSANIFTADGKPYAAADTIAVALDWLVQQKAPVINISLAGPRNALLDRVVVRAIAKGSVIVAAAGNGGPAAAPAYPGAIAGVIAATAVDGANHIYRNANQGNYVFVAALGVGVPAAAPDGMLAAYSGTSFAAPLVAASMARCKRASGTAACIDRMRTTAIDLGAPGWDAVYGWGLIRN